MSKSRRRLPLLVAVFALGGGAIASAASAPEHPTEPFFPRSGNRGYNVTHSTSTG